MAETRTHNLFNEITAIDSNSLAVLHDRAGNMTRFPGALTGSEPLVATWDAWNRLIGLSTTSGTAVAAYAYDGDWKHLKKTVGSAVSEYYYEDMQLAEIRTNGVANEQFVYDSRYLHSVALRDRDTDGDGDCTNAGGSERLFYCNDGNFNVTALVSANGTVVERYTYDPYGKVTIRDAVWQPITWDSSQKNVCLYTGHKFDAESGLYYSLYRYYHPGLGRWAARDPLGDRLKSYMHRGKWGARRSYQFLRMSNSTGEKIGLNQVSYTFVRNRSPVLHDQLGLCSSSVAVGPMTLRDDLRTRCEAANQWYDERGPVGPAPRPLPVEEDRKCQGTVDMILRNAPDPNLRRTLDYLRNHKCAPTIVCMCCDESVGGAFNPPLHTIEICWRGSPTDVEGLERLLETLTHEFTHALQDCVGERDMSCEMMFARELEAYYCGGGCNSFASCARRSVNSACAQPRSNRCTPEAIDNYLDWWREWYDTNADRFCVPGDGGDRFAWPAPPLPTGTPML